MRLHHVGKALASIAVAILATGAAMAQTPDQVQFLVGDGRVVVTWMAPAGNVTGYNVYQYEPASPTSDPGTGKKLNADPIKETSFTVEGLKNGTCYHFRVSAIVDGKESAQVGPAPGQGNSGDHDVGLVSCAVPQKPVTLSGIDGFVGYNVGTNTPGSFEITPQGQITMKAGGWDIWNSADGFYYLATPIEGDVTVTVRVVSGPTATSEATGNGWELGGPMIRESLDTRSRFAMMQISNGRNGNAHQFKKRVTFDETPENDDITPASGDTTERPVWARIQRRGNEFHAWISEDGKTFNEAGSGVTFDNFVRTAFVGLAFSAHDNTKEGILTTVVLDNLTITKP
jgi:hypothetical protein